MHDRLLRHTRWISAVLAVLFVASLTVTVDAVIWPA
jgi:hypothetical protein